MTLKSIEISGFKSFGKKGTLEFSVPISSIVGPNGSGKSNVAEAFRFVLGEQSIKSLRGKRAEDLIFNGGKDAARSNRASVKLTFDNTQRIFNIDFDDVSIERVVNRDSSSEYLINGSPVRLKDITELLSNAHIGASGHQIISQGEADKILNANTKEKREIIEEALGLKIFQYKKEESTRKLEKTEENTKQVESLRREIAPHIKFLKKQVEKIEKGVEMKEDLIKKYLEYFKREEEYINHERKNIESGRKPQLEKMHELEKSLIEAKNILEKSSTKDKKTSEIIEIENKLKENRNSKDSLSRNIGKVEGQIDSLIRILEKQKIAALQNNDKKIELGKVESLAGEINKEIDSFFDSLDISKIKNIFQSIRGILKNFIESHKDGEDKKATDEIESDIRNLENEKKNYEHDLKALNSFEAELSEKYTILKNEIEKEKDTNRDAEKAMFRIIAEQNEVRNRLNIFASHESNLRHTEEEFKRETQEAGMLVGVYALRYKDHLPKNNDGAPTTLEEILKEPREVQESRKREIEKLKVRLEDSGIAGGDDVMKEFKETSERDAFLMKELEDLARSSESLKVLIKELDEKLTNEFKLGVQKINNKFSEFFGAMFGGGFASLTVVKEKKKKKSDTDLSMLEEGGELQEEDEGEEGLDIEVKLPRKKIKGLMMLSGGERALTSIALLFAISAVNPPPFIILDETDAALDEANSKKYGDMIADLSKYSQLILITHNRETMARAGIIYGVTMGNDGISRLLSIQFEEAVTVAK